MNEGKAGVKDGINFSGDSSSCGFSAWVWGIFQKPSHRPLSSLNNLCLLLWIGRSHPYIRICGMVMLTTRLQEINITSACWNFCVCHLTYTLTNSRTTQCCKHKHGSHDVVVYMGHMVLSTRVTCCCLHGSHVVYTGHMLFATGSCLEGS